MATFPNKESGTSLIELMISLMLFAVIGTFTAKFFQRNQAAEYEQRARSTANNHIELTRQAIERDLQRRVLEPSGKMKSPCGGGFCDSFSYVRVAKSKSGKEDSKYTMQWLSQCKTLQANIKALYGKTLDLSRDGINKIVKPSAPNYPRCMAAKNCPYGQFSQITHQVPASAKADYNNSKAPSYPVGAFPANDQKFQRVADGMVAAAICADGTNSNLDKVIMDVAILTESKTIRFEKKEILIPRRSVGNMQILSE